jgi:hypothetical protein
MGGVSFHPGGYRALVEVELQPKGYAAFLIYTLSDRTSRRRRRCACRCRPVNWVVGRYETGVRDLSWCWARSDEVMS